MSAVSPAEVELLTVIVNWNTVGLLDECLDSVVRATPAWVRNDIVVVDNGSDDGSVEHLRQCWPRVRVIANEDNRGFCRANNQALRESEAPFALLVNTDARLGADGIASLLTYFERDPRAAVVAPRLVYADGAFQRWTAGRLPSLSSVAVYLSGLDRVAPTRGLYLGADVTEAFRPQWVSSAVMALRRDALDEIGLLDERIFVYMDDVDLCARAARAGWNVWYAADTTATHFMGSSTRRVTGRASPEALRALNRWHQQQRGSLRTTALRALEAAGFAGRAGVHGLRSIGRKSSARSQLSVNLTHLRLALEPTSSRPAAPSALRDVEAHLTSPDLRTSLS